MGKRKSEQKMNKPRPQRPPTHCFVDFVKYLLFFFGKEHFMCSVKKPNNKGAWEIFFFVNFSMVLGLKSFKIFKLLNEQSIWNTFG